MRAMADVNTYQQQVEAGKEYVKEILGGLAAELERPDINRFEFQITDHDFDRQEISIVDPVEKRIVAKLSESNLADQAGTPSLKRKLKDYVTAAVNFYFEAKTEKGTD
jgi:hypothetical protein